MTAVWWSKAASPETRNAAASSGPAPSEWPVLTDATRDAVYQQLLNRANAYASEWTNRGQGDAGIAVAHLFSEEMEPVLQRLNQLPQNSFIEFLKIGGIQPFPPTSAMALLQLKIADAATQSVYIPQGFQVGASPAGGGNMVIFETNSDLYAAPGKIQEMYAFAHGLYDPIPPAANPPAPFQPFGAHPRPGLAFFIGLSTTPGVIVGPQISLGFQVQGLAGQPPVASGGVVPLPAPLAPLLRWDVLDGAQYQQAEIVTDETNGLAQSGVITLRLPVEWNPGIPSGAPDTAPLLWLRLQILYGSYPVAPVLTGVQLNVVRATAEKTIYNEVLTPVTGTNASVMTLSQTPVLPNSLILQVDDSTNITFNSSLAPATSSPAASSISTTSVWTEVDDLADFGPTAQVYALDPASGEVTFGDGIHGMAVPVGFRNVVALRYKVGGGAGGAVPAGAITTMISSVPFVTGVTNPWPATGGTDAETQSQALNRGPQEIRARGRAVASADYEVLALHSTGALVARSHAVPGLHPAFAGTPIPGVVCVFVIPVERGSGPPIPDQDTLRAVSTYLSEGLAPAGVEVVAAAPAYHSVRVEVSVVIDASVSRGNTVNAVLALLNSYLDPVTGGDDGRGWPFGGTLFNTPLVRKLVTEVNGVSAVPSLRFVVDGVRGAACTDFPISANSLVWPQMHQVLALAPGEEP
jgi:predicted phage baseplate assembly protein